MKDSLQWKTSVAIRAPRERVWAIVDDISRIPEYHPEVRKVELLSDRNTRAAGVRYRCIIPEGRKGSCVEEVVDYVPGERMTIAIPEDTWGLSRMLAGFLAETALVPRGEAETVVTLEAYYRPVGWKARLLNPLILRRLMAGRARRTLEGIKRLAEAGSVS